MTRERQLSSPQSFKVLRGVLVHGQPHTLARPGRVDAESVARIPHVHPGRTIPDVAAADTGLNTQLSFEDGLAEGRKQGCEAAMAQAAEEGRERATELAEFRALAAAEARLEGLARGREEALLAASQAEAQATERLDQAISERLGRFDHLLESLILERARRLEETEEDLVALSHEIVCSILGAQAATPECVRSMVMHLLVQDGQRTQLAVHVHPDDLAALMKEGVEQPWQWVGDKAVQLGGVVLRSPEGSLDARLETQLAALRDALLLARRDRVSAGISQAVQANPDREDAA